jgi:hypothetical protein
MELCVLKRKLLRILDFVLPKEASALFHPPFRELEDKPPVRFGMQHCKDNI